MFTPRRVKTAVEVRARAPKVHFIFIHLCSNLLSPRLRRIKKLENTHIGRQFIWKKDFKSTLLVITHILLLLLSPYCCWILVHIDWMILIITQFLNNN